MIIAVSGLLSSERAQWAFDRPEICRYTHTHNAQHMGRTAENEAFEVAVLEVNCRFKLTALIENVSREYVSSCAPLPLCSVFGANAHLRLATFLLKATNVRSIVASVY